MGWFKRERGTKTYYYATFMAGKGADRRQEQEYAGTTKKQALELAAKRAREVRDGTYSKEHRTAAVTVAAYAKTWGVARTNKTADDDRARLRDHVVPHIGHMRMADVEPKTLRDLINKLVELGTIAPATIHNVYGSVSTMFRTAVFEKLIPATPCVLLKGMLPAIPSKPKAIYEKSDLLKLVTCEKIPLDRRTFYALTGLSAMRHGEAAGRRWRDYDTGTPILGCLSVDTQYDGEPLKSPDGEPRPRRVPVHPTLARLLQHWRHVGFPQMFGRSPRPEDFIVPSRRGPQHCRTVRRSLACLTETREPKGRAGHRLSDCDAAGVTPLTFHRLRDTCISLARRDGARKDVFERISHNSKGDIVDGYTLFDWAPLCEAMLCLRFELPDPPTALGSGPGGDDGGVGHDTDHELSLNSGNPGGNGPSSVIIEDAVFEETALLSDVGGRVRVPSAPLSLQPDSAVEKPPDERCHTKCHNGFSETNAVDDQDEADFRAALAEEADRARPSALARTVRVSRVTRRPGKGVA
jgi:integrase